MFVVGIGPGGIPDRTPRAEAAISHSRVVVGYSRYLDHVRDLIAGKETVSSGMTREEERCRVAVEKARDGAWVALISSGDPGVYGMAGLAMEIADQIAPDLVVEIVPGITAANAAAAAMGAPLMLDYAVISLSDLLVPWDQIRRRLEAVAAADLVTALYNPRSTKRIRHLEEAVEIFLKHRPFDTPVGVGTGVGTPEETIVISILGNLPSLEVDMRSMVIIGNRSTRNIRGHLVTPRGYRL